MKGLTGKVLHEKDFISYWMKTKGNYAEVLQNYYEVTRLEIDLMIYSITSNGEHTKVSEYYFQALE